MTDLTHDEIQRLKTENAELRAQLEQATTRALSITNAELREQLETCRQACHVLAEQLEQATTRAEAAEAQIDGLTDDYQHASRIAHQAEQELSQARIRHEHEHSQLVAQLKAMVDHLANGAALAMPSITMFAPNAELAELRAYRERTEAALAELSSDAWHATEFVLVTGPDDLCKRGLWRELQPSPAAPVEPQILNLGALLKKSVADTEARRAAPVEHTIDISPGSLPRRKPGFGFDTPVEREGGE